MKRGKPDVLFDVDSHTTFVPALHQLLDDPSVSSVFHADFTQDGLPMVFHELAHQTVTTPMLLELRAEAARIIWSRYTSAAVYHFCCPRDRRSYAGRGLLISTKELLYQLAHEVFGQLPNFDEKFDTVCENYLAWYEGTVGLWLTAYETNGQHKGHFLGKMSEALGERGQHVLSEHRHRCVPSLVKCGLPLDWLEHKMREPAIWRFASAALQKMILFRESPEDTHCSFGALGSKCSIPADMIIDILDPPNE